MIQVLINGQPANAIDVHDRGIHYGDGVFETLAVIDNEPRMFAAHWRRLAAGCKRLGIVPPQQSEVEKDIQVIGAGLSRLVVKLIVTRGTGNRGYGPPPDAHPRRILISYPWPGDLEDSQQHGVAVKVCTTRLGSNPALAGIKHLNRLEQVLAASELAGTEFAEGLTLDQQGNLIEGTRSNIFVVAEGRLMTPALSDCGVQGVMRDYVLELARSRDLPTEVLQLPGSVLATADELFLTNSIGGIVPVVRIEQRRLAVGNTTRSLQRCVAGDSDS